jgi:hypothetical protein
MGAESSTMPHRFSVDHSQIYMPTLAPVVPKSLPPISGSDAISYVRSQSYTHLVEPIPEVNVPRHPPSRGYSGMETSYNAPCDEYIADIELKRKKPVDPITGKPQSWFSTKSKVLGKSDSSHTPLTWKTTHQSQIHHEDRVILSSDLPLKPQKAGVCSHRRPPSQ